jgi:oxaloacetate decarboxylase alpha subunit
VLDRIMATPAARAHATRERLPPMVEKVRARYGGRISDDEVLLRIMFPEEHVEAMLAAAPVDPGSPPVSTPLVELVRDLCARPRRFGYVSLRTDGLELTLSATAAPEEGPSRPEPDRWRAAP